MCDLHCNLKKQICVYQYSIWLLIFPRVIIMNKKNKCLDYTIKNFSWLVNVQAPVVNVSKSKIKFILKKCDFLSQELL